MRLIDADALEYSIAGNIPLMPTVRIAIEHRIDDAPTIEAEPVKRGRWIAYQQGQWIYAKCSECESVQDVQSNYCPSCGARMNKEK